MAFVSFVNNSADVISDVFWLCFFSRATLTFHVSSPVFLSRLSFLPLHPHPQLTPQTSTYFYKQVASRPVHTWKGQRPASTRTGCSPKKFEFWTLDTWRATREILSFSVWRQHAFVAETSSARHISSLRFVPDQFSHSCSIVKRFFVWCSVYVQIPSHLMKVIYVHRRQRQTEMLHVPMHLSQERKEGLFTCCPWRRQTEVLRIFWFSVQRILRHVQLTCSPDLLRGKVPGGLTWYCGSCCHCHHSQPLPIDNRSQM